MNACEETYHDVKRMIYKLAHDACQRYGGDVEEYVSAGNEAYMRAYRAHDPRKSSFITFLWYCVSNAIRDVQRRELSYRGRYERLGNGDGHVQSKEQPAWLSDLSSDARLVVNSMAQTPGDLRLLLKPANLSRLRQGLYRMLKTAGWSPARIIECREEIREGLGLTGGDDD